MAALTTSTPFTVVWSTSTITQDGGFCPKITASMHSARLEASKYLHFRSEERRVGKESRTKRRRHTRWPRDWSSDVCSSDLPRIFKVDPRDRHGSPLKRDGGIDHLDAIHGGLVDQHDHPGRGLLSQDHRQHALGQAGSVKVLTF